MDLVSQNLLMTSGGKKDPVYLDDVFSTYLYRGNGASQTISNGIKLSNNNAGNGVKFSGSSGQLEVASTSDFAFGTDPFTIEFWLYFQSTTDYCAMFEGRPNSGNGNYLTFGFASGYLSSYSDSAYRTQGSSGTTAPAVNQWTHIALVREGTGTNQEKIYFNGTQVAQGTNPINIGNQRCMIAGHAWSRGNFNGHISNYRVTKGQALYTSNFTPSTQALTTTSQGAIASNVKLLCCNKNIVTGATVTPGTITVTSGNPVSQGFGPFTATDGEGGMVWTKSRSSNGHIVTDTVRGAGKGLVPNSNDASSNNLLELSSFNNSGFSIGNNYIINTDAESYASWTWRINKGFFDVVQYTGNGSAGHQVAHSLGCEVGFMMVKRLENAANWSCYHRDAQTSGAYLLTLNSSGGAGAVTDIWNDTAPTSTHFTLGTSSNTNGNGETYICYLFAGGESTAATATSNGITGAGEFQYITGNADYAAGTNDFTVECWVKPSSWDTGGPILAFGASTNNGLHITRDGSNNRLRVIPYGGSNIVYSTTLPTIGIWTHIAVSRASGTTKIFINGIEEGSASDSTSYVQGDSFYLGYSGTNAGTTGYGKYSNVRFVNGTAVYTSSFRPPYEPLTNITNTKLLFAQGSTTTSATVIASGGVINNNGTIVHSSTDSPFDDPGGFKFGEEGDQNIIKTGSYVGRGSGSGKDVDVNLGWEPQWIMVKSLGSSDSWIIFDSMRGIVTGGNESYLYANSVSSEYSAADRLELTSTGFKVLSATPWSATNTNGITYSFVAIRRPDGNVGKPVVAGTDVFAMDTWVSDSTPNNQPNMISNFPVDFVLDRDPTYNGSWQGNWHVRGRLIQNLYLKTNSTDAEGTGTWGQFDYSNGWMNRQSLTGYTNWQSWMFKRHAGFDVVTYKGNGVAGRQIKHNLNVTPEMIWVKDRDSGSANWVVWHKGLNGGTNAFNYYILLNSNAAQIDDSGESTQKFHTSTPPTSMSVSLGSSGWTNSSSARKCLMMLFASVEGVSKVGYYTGTGSTQTITTGFQPRFAIIKRINATQHWYVFDTLRGWTSGNDQYIKLDLTDAQAPADLGEPTSTGFQVGSDPTVGANGDKYIYYAHA